MKQSEINNRARARRFLALQMVDDEQKTYREVAEAMGISQTRVGQMVYRARKELEAMGPAIDAVIQEKAGA